ncbi:MAG: hypothetical protein AAFY38_11530 [Pseudomonadota bacterium]
MFRTSLIALALALPAAAHAQTQQAGTATDTDAAFQALIDACDDTDALMLRARIRLQLPRTTDAAAATAQGMMEEAFAACGEGDPEAAKAQLAEALKIAEDGATEVFAATEAAEAEAEAAAAAADAAAEEEETTRPWWKFW